MGPETKMKKKKIKIKRPTVQTKLVSIIVAFIINWPVQLGKIVDPSDEPVER